MFTSRFSVLATLALIASASALATRAPASNQVIHPTFSDTKCLTAVSNANNAAVQIEDCVLGAANQLWTITGSTVTIFGNKCLDDTNGNTANGQKLQIFTCVSGNTNQRWVYNAQPFQFQLIGTNKCMDLTDGNRNNGNVVQIFDCNVGGNQQWNIADGSTVKPPSSRAIRPLGFDQTCLTVQQNADNAPVVVQPCDGSVSQRWTLSSNTISIYGNKCLDVTSGSLTVGTKMQVFTCFTGNTNQQFTLSTPPGFPNSNQIHWADTRVNECLDLTDGRTTNGNQIQVYTCASGNRNQIFNVV